MSNKDTEEDILNDSEKVIIKMIKHNRGARENCRRTQYQCSYGKISFK